MSDEKEDSYQDIVTEQKIHFDRLYEKNTGTPNAVASETYKHKNLRYQKIADIFPNSGNFSIYEVGYGLGHFYEYIKKSFDLDRITYSGSELVEKYYNHCTEIFNPTGEFELRNILENPLSEKYDYVIMSGVFHQIGDTAKEPWEEYMYALLKRSYESSTRGIAFNFLSHPVDYEIEGNYYAHTSDVMDFANKHLSRFFELKRDYPLFEVTMIVYRTEYIVGKYPDGEFQKYI